MTENKIPVILPATLRACAQGVVTETSIPYLLAHPHLDQQFQFLCILHFVYLCICVLVYISVFVYLCFGEFVYSYICVFVHWCFIIHYFCKTLIGQQVTVVLKEI